MGNDLVLLLTNLMELFVKPDALNENNTGYKLATLDVDPNKLPAKKINIGTSARQALVASGILNYSISLNIIDRCASSLCSSSTGA